QKALDIFIPQSQAGGLKPPADVYILILLLDQSQDKTEDTEIQIRHKPEHIIDSQILSGAFQLHFCPDIPGVQYVFHCFFLGIPSSQIYPCTVDKGINTAVYIVFPLASGFCNGFYFFLSLYTIFVKSFRYKYRIPDLAAVNSLC